MRIIPLLLGVALVGGCTPPSGDAPKPPVERDRALEQARGAVAESENAVLANRVHALEVEVARIENAPEAAKMQLLDDRLKALELKVYAAAPEAPPAAPDRPATPIAPKPAAIRKPRVVNPFPTYRRPTQAERDAAAGLAR